MERVAVIMGKMHSGGKKNLVMEYYRNIDKSKVQFDFSVIRIQMLFHKKKLKNWVVEYIELPHIRIFLRI